MLEGNNTERKTAKGVSKVVNRKMRLNEYYEALFCENRSTAQK